jgi:hypothetical protein
MPSKPKMTVEELKAHPLFGVLTERQKNFILAFISNGGDIAAAILTAGFSTKRPQLVGRRVMGSAYVRKLLSLYYGYTLENVQMSRLELAGLIAARLRDPKIGHNYFKNLATLWMEIALKPKNGGTIPKTKNIEDALVENEASIDDLVKQIEKQQKETSNG